MTFDLDQLLIRLRDAPPDSRLDGTEQRVWAHLEEERLEAMCSGGWGWRALLAAIMLCVGIFACGMKATKHQDSSPFAIPLSMTRCFEWDSNN